MRPITRRRGLFATELIVVVVLIAFIASIASAVYNKLHQNALNETLNQQFAIVSQAIQLYEADQGSLPDQLDDLTRSGMYQGNTLESPYLREVPNDPFSKNPLPFTWHKNQTKLRSVGMDSISNTSDDVCYNVRAQERVIC